MRNVGRMRKVSIERLTETRGEYGEATRSWSPHKTMYAEVKPISGREYFAADKETTMRTILFYMHYTKDISVKDRIAYESEHYDITYIREIGLREALEVTGVIHK